VLETGRPVSTGRMIDGGGTLNGVPVKNIGNWGEVKAQAVALLGIALVDSDVFNVPLIATDPYGRFLRGPNGFPLMIMQNGTAVEGNPAAPIPTAGARRINHGFLDDIAHNAVPAPGLAPDGDQAPNPIDVPRPDGTYDDELLAAHFVTGDGRGNENIALTAVHTVFHAEHNRLRDNIDQLINAAGFLTTAEVAAWHAQAPQPPAGSGWGYGERLFQAARFVTEMQYQHLVFEEFARKMVPSINPFVGDGINFINDTNPAITAEFAHQAYRLGHSMLTETISRTNQNGSTNDISLIDGFLNPLEFNNGGPAGPLTAAQAAGAIFQGGTRQVANEIDEFVTEAVRNNLLGLPLDLPVLNLARGRSEGVPPLNEIRRQLYFGTNPQPQFQPPPIGDPAIAPYANWFDFEFALKHQESLVNFIAAYGIDPRGAGQPLNIAGNMAEKRAAAQLLIDDADFMFADGATTGVERIDLWMGGLAEKVAPFGSLLGTTFNYIFEVQLENLQNADRFYYLERLDGLNLLSQMEGNSFFELISRNTTLKGASADVFARPDLVLNLPVLLATAGVITDDPDTPVNESTMPDLRLIGGTLRYSGPLHVVWNGRDVADRVFSSEGDDTLRGDDGPDVMEGGPGNDNFIGGDGDDILTDTFGEDVIKGGRGNDAIHGGSGPFDLLQGNEGNDYIVGGNDLSEVFGGPGNDIIYMGAGLSESIGGEGDDWMEGTESPASILIGDDNNQFQDDPNGGHDVLIARGGDADFDSEGGDDIMVGTVIPTHRLEGMLGFDWATYRGEVRPVDADMLITGAIAVNAPLNELRDRYDLTEGLSGTNFNDLLRGDNRVEADLRDDGLTGVTNGHVLTAAGIARIAGIAAILPAGATEFAGGNIILGGLGADLLEGRGGNDILDGDRWLNVQLRAPNVATADTSDFVFVNSLDALKTDVFAGRINPSQITIVRSIVTPATVPAADCNVTPASAQVNCDTAAFSGPLANYSWVVNADGSVTVTDNVGTDGVDTLRNIERLQFTDVAVPPVPTVPAVVNLTQAAALSAITSAGFTSTVTTANSTTVAAGLVISQTPTAGTVATAGSNVAIVVSLGAPPPPAPTGLVLALGFNEASGTTVIDSSPSPKNGTIRGAVRAAGRAGSGNALRFDGVDDWVTITDTTASKLDLTNGMTLEAWVNPTAMSGWETILMKERGIQGEGLLSYALYAHDGAPQAGGTARPSGYVRVNPVASTTDTAVRGTAALTLNTWTHIAVTYDGANLRFYVNGVLRGTTARTGNIASNNGAVRIGGNNSSLQEFFRGLIDDVRIYNRALTAAQITADMNAPIQ
jgi:Ca2+-binding RTX toxin-like protein